ncbi:MAG: NADPH:quinone reductase [Pseudomonadota bacterium]
MKAAVYTETGGPEVLKVIDVDDPTPGPGEVIVRVHAHGVNPTDWKRRSGQRGPLTLPQVIPGYDAAGEIVAVGDGVPDRTGERVWVWEGAHQKWDGTMAEMVRVPASRAMPLPQSVSFDEGAALGVPAMTACHALMLAGDLAGETAIVTGAAGAVCNYAVQLAKAMGATVIGVVRGDAQREEDAATAGADHVLNTDRDDFRKCALELTDGKGAKSMIDVDLGAHLDFAWRIVAQNGTIASFGSATNPAPTLDWPKFMYRNIALRGVAIFEVPEEAKLRAAAFVQQCLEQGKLWHRIDRTFPLAEAAEAHRHQENGSPRGKIIVTP